MRVKSRVVRTAVITVMWLGVTAHWLEYKILRRPRELQMAESVPLAPVEVQLDLEGAVLDPPSVEANAADDYLVVLNRFASEESWTLSDEDVEAVVRATKKKQCDFAALDGRVTGLETCFGIISSTDAPVWHFDFLGETLTWELMLRAREALARQSPQEALEWYSRAVIIGYHLCMDRKFLQELEIGVRAQQQAADGMDRVISGHSEFSEMVPRLGEYRRTLGNLASELRLQKMSFVILRQVPISYVDLHEYIDLLYTEAAVRAAKHSPDVLVRLWAVFELGGSLAYATELKWELFRVKRFLRHMAVSDKERRFRTMAASALKRELYIPTY